ncbi:ribonuclease P protein component [Saccharopolyspora gloriosae]|uniref:ribonuclease P protein component n=1 Tax=Saccharopolyspora gloriosae TaxID=455344 RepID=UPI001FB6B221|nr:ribonuclease P protein component [Saccharopolyspora gloriosae]
MLPAAARLTTSQEFRLAVRRGRRAGRARLVVHLLTPSAANRTEVRGAAHGSARPEVRATSTESGRDRRDPAVGDSDQVARPESDPGRSLEAAHARSASSGPGAESAVSSTGDSRPHSDIEPTRDTGEPARVGFVVSKAVGNAVLRHRVTRRLRHLMRDRLPLLPAGTLVVVRALPPAANAPSRELGSDLDAALRKLRVVQPGGPVAGSR